MNSLVCDRFLSTLKDDAERLKKLGQGGLNPKETNTFGNFGGVFSDRCEYMYSLYSLDSVFSRVHQVWRNLTSGGIGDSHRFHYEYGFASLLGFELRGYVGAFSEEVMMLERHKLNSLSGFLREWLELDLLAGSVQDDLRVFLWNYAATKICDINPDTGVTLSKQDKNRYIEQRVTREMLAFRDVLEVSSYFVKTMFDAVLIYNDVSRVPLLGSGT